MVPRPDMVHDVARTLRAFCRGEAQAQETERLIRLAAALAARRLHGRLGAAARFDGASRDQVALSLVAGLFAERDGVPQIRESLAEYLDQDDESLFLRFQAVVVCSASQELFHRWHENDSLSSRLWRTLQRSMRHDTRLTLVPTARPEWVALAGQAHYKAERPPASSAQLEPIVRFHHTTTGFTGDLIVRVLTDLARLENCAQIVSIELLFLLLRDQTRELAAAELRSEALGAPVHTQVSMAIGEARSAARTEVAARLQRYLTTGKITDQQADLFVRALDDIVADCADGGPAQSYYHYLRAHAGDLKLEDYRRQWRTRFEYLAEAARDRFFECLRDKLKPDVLQSSTTATIGNWQPGEGAS